MITSLRHSPLYIRIPTVLALIGLALTLAACDLGNASPSTPSANATPTATTPPLAKPAIHQLSLGYFNGNAVFPDPHGLVVYGTPGNIPDHLGPAGAYGVYFYDFSTQSVQTLATPTPAPDGTMRGVQIAQPGGDWIIYELADANSAHWSLRAVNILTHEDRLIDSYLLENSASLAQMYGGFASDGVNLIWSAGIQTTGAPTFVLKEYTFATGMTKTLMSGPTTPILTPRAVVDGTVLLDVRHLTAGPTDGMYLWTLSDPAPKQISPEDGTNAHLNDHYAVWDQPQTRSLTLYNRDTGKLTEQWVTACIRPDIALDRPYVICLDIDHSQLFLVQVPSAQEVYIGSASTGETGAIANGRDYWVVPGASGPSSNTVDYIDLPAN